MDDHELERLLRLAGPRRTVPDDRVARVRAAVHDAWRASVRARAIRLRALTGVGVLAAAAVIVLAVAPWRGWWSTRFQPGGVDSSRSARLQPSGAGAVPVGRILTASGGVTVQPGAAAAVQSGQILQTGQTIQLARGALASLAFDGGGELRLDSETVVALVEARELSVERGAVYIDSDASRGAGPVTVRTRFGVVRDIGTRFEVRVGDNGLRVRVRDGSVAYERDAVRRTAAAGAELIASPDGALESRPIPSDGSEWSWAQRASAFAVEGRPLAEFLEWVAREGGRRIEWASAALERESAAITLHGSIEGLTADEAVAVILPTCGLDHRLEADRLLIFKGGR